MGSDRIAQKMLFCFTNINAEILPCLLRNAKDVSCNILQHLSATIKFSRILRVKAFAAKMLVKSALISHAKPRHTFFVCLFGVYFFFSFILSLNPFVS